MTETPDLAELSAAATRGKWTFRSNYGDRRYGILSITTSVGIPKTDAEFIVALVNKYRAGDLIPRAEVAEKLAERRATWCLAWPGSDEEMSALLTGFDSAVEIALASPGHAQGERE